MVRYGVRFSTRESKHAQPNLSIQYHRLLIQFFSASPPSLVPIRTNTALREVLEQNGFKVDSYDDPLLALDNFKAHLYDLVILDIKMPDMNGFSFYREIKKLDKNRKICFLTAGEMYYGIYSDIFSSLPASYFIRKSIGNEELIKKIHEIINDATIRDIIVWGS